MEEQKHIHEHKNVGRIDEIVLGTPSRGGSITAKVDWSYPEEASKLVDNALAERERASIKHQESLQRETEMNNKKRE